MAEPPSEHDDHASVDDFAPERPAVQPRHVDLESVVLWLADSWRESRAVRSGFAGILALLVVGGVGLAWWGIRSADLSGTAAEPLASFRVKEQPIDPPAIVFSLPSTDFARAVSVGRSTPPIEKSQLAPGNSSSGRVGEKQSPAATAAASASQVSPPMPRPATASDLSSSLPRPTSEEEPPARVAVSEPPPPPPVTTAPRSSEGVTTWGSSRSGVDDPESVAIQDVLGRYRTAYAALDVAAVHHVWPSVNQRSLERAFRQLEGQDVSFFSCTIDLDGARAEAACVGTTNFIPKVGNRSQQSGPSQWNFKLSKRSAGGWLIDDAQAR
jgi:hypothetical protein